MFYSAPRTKKIWETHFGGARIEYPFSYRISWGLLQSVTWMHEQYRKIVCDSFLQNNLFSRNSVTKQPTRYERREWVVRTSASYSRGFWFEYLPGGLRRLSWFSSVPPGNCWDSALNYDTTASSHTFTFVIQKSFNHRTLYNLNSWRRRWITINELNSLWLINPTVLFQRLSVY
jgi:hypothetical protein